MVDMVDTDTMASVLLKLTPTLLLLLRPLLMLHQRLLLLLSLDMVTMEDMVIMDITARGLLRLNLDMGMEVMDMAVDMV